MIRGISPRLSIKSSFANPVEGVVLVYLLWICSGRQDQILVGEDGWAVEKNKIVLSNEQKKFIADYFQKEESELKFLEKNVLVDTQMEPMQVFFLNIMKMALIEFQDPSLSDSSERVGKVRYPKKFILTSVIDALDFSLSLYSEQELKSELLDILNKKFENKIFEFLRGFISFWSEQVKYYSKDKLLYESIAKGIKENIEYFDSGPARIIKNLKRNKLVLYDHLINGKESYYKRVKLFGQIYSPNYLEEINDPPQINETIDETYIEVENNEIPLNILLRGVPGTGKSTLVDDIIKNLISNNDERIDNVLRLNIHSATTNTSLMQGVSVSLENGNIIYKEKEGILLSFILKAIKNPLRPYVLVLEEVQENNLNELIGDLIYLIEIDKRANLINHRELLSNYENPYDAISEIVRVDNKVHFVSIPNLIESSKNKDLRKIVVPKNLYIFCTSNYREDKKVLEDNLLRRFHVIELYPQESLIENKGARIFFKSLNNSILNHIEPDISEKFLIGHADWMKVNSNEDFYRSLLKVVIEFKDIKGFDFNTTIEILKDCDYTGLHEDLLDFSKLDSYFDLTAFLQTKSLYKFLG